MFQDRSQNFSYLRPNIPPFTFGVLSRCLTKILEIMGRIKAKWSQDNEGSISEDKNLYVLIKPASRNAHLGTRHTSCSWLQEMRTERAYIR